MKKKIVMKKLISLPLSLISYLFIHQAMAQIIKVDQVVTSSDVRITEQIGRVCNGIELCQFIPASEVRTSANIVKDTVKVDFSCLKRGSEEVIAKGEVSGSANELVEISCREHLAKHEEYHYPVSYREYAKGGILGGMVALAVIALMGR